jgi:hypothetical protein
MASKTTASFNKSCSKGIAIFGVNLSDIGRLINGGNFMWSDECSAERGRGKLVEWCFGTSSNKWKPEFVKTYKKGKDISVMV